MDNIFHRDDKCKENKEIEIHLVDYIQIDMESHKDSRHMEFKKTFREMREVKMLAHDFREVFAWSYDEFKLHYRSIMEHTIPLKDIVGLHRKNNRNMNPKLALLVWKELQKMVDAKIISPCRRCCL